MYIPVDVQEGQDYQGTGTGQVLASVIVDNYTTSWIHVPAAARYVPPLRYGVSFPVTANSQDSRILWRTPPGVIVPVAGVPPAQAHVIFTDTDVGYSNGSAASAASQTAILIGQGTSVKPNVTFAIPPGLFGVGLFSQDSNFTQIFGHQSGIEYMSGLLPVLPLNFGSAQGFGTGIILLNPVDTSLDLVFNTVHPTYLVGYPAPVQGVQIIAALDQSSAGGASGLPTLPGVPPTGGILDGAGNATVAGTTIITIPVNSLGVLNTWYGTITIGSNTVLGSDVWFGTVCGGACIPAAGGILFRSSGGIGPAVPFVSQPFYVRTDLFAQTVALKAFCNGVDLTVPCHANGLLLK